MTKHTLLAALAAATLVCSNGCVWWRHCWGSWAYYGVEDSCGYCDNCPPGPCAAPGHRGPFCGLFRGLFPGVCGDCCDDCGECGYGGTCGQYDCCAADGNVAGYCSDGGCGGCGRCDDCRGYGPFHGLFRSPGPVGCHDYPCQGCGERYFCDWINYPPTCDPCDCCGNYVPYKEPRPCYQLPPRAGSIPLHDGGVIGADAEYEYIDQEYEYIEQQPQPVGSAPRRRTSTR